MAKVIVKTKVKKVKKKYPIEIKAPEYLNSFHIGNSQVTDLASTVGKTSKINLMYVTNNVKNQNIRLTFRIIEVASGLAKTEVVVYEQIPYYLGRHVKAGSELIEDSFSVKSKDGREVVLKPFIVGKENASSLIKSLLRKKTRELVSKELEKTNSDEYMAAVINGKVQTVYKNEIKKIFPIKALEFRMIQIK